MKPIVLLGLLTAFFAAAGAAAAPELLLPKDKAVTGSDRVLLLGKGTPGQSIPLRVESDGSTAEGTARAKDTGAFWFLVPLQPGLNTLELGGRRVQVFRTENGGTAPAGFRPQRLHSGGISKCADCHEDDLRVRVEGVPGVCLRCHEIAPNNPRHPGRPEDDRHYRASTSRCSRCHDPHGATEPKLLLDATEALCGTCHGNIGMGKGAHPALDQGGCTACHSPHFSGYPKGLRQPEPAVCQDCHDQGKPQGDARFHPTLTDPGSCSVCHAPHGATGGGMLRKPARQLCTTCHAAIGAGRVVHAALDDGCGTCHGLHRADDRKQAARTCGDCHDTTGDRGLAASHGNLAIGPEACGGCHLPHASEQDHLLRKGRHEPVADGDCSACHERAPGSSPAAGKPTATCLDCHDSVKGLSGPGNALHQPAADGECVTCHAPHGSERTAHLRGPVRQLCGECHDQPSTKDGRVAHSAADACTDCHHPHGGKNPRFLATPLADLCAECHDNPTAGKAKAHPALDEGCGACHDPHSGFGAATLKTPPRALCLECHSDPTAGKAVSHRPARDGCTGCHDPHGGNGAAYLRTPVTALCAKCHDPQAHRHSLNAESTTRNFPRAADFPREGKVLACIGCHAPHSSAEKGLLVRPKQELCDGCHAFIGIKLSD